MRCHVIAEAGRAASLLKRLVSAGWIASSIDPRSAMDRDWQSVITDAIILLADGERELELARRLSNGRLTAALVGCIGSGTTASALLAAGCDAVAGDGLAADAIEALVLRCVLLRQGWRSPILQLGPLCVDLGARQASIDGARLKLWPIEFRLLACLALRAGRIVTRTELLELLYAEGEAPRPRTLDSIVAGLRCAILHPASSLALVTRHGGFRLDAPRPVAAAARGVILAGALPPPDWELDGFDWVFSVTPATDKVRRLRQENPHAPIVVVTAGDPDVMLKAGADAVLPPELPAAQVATVLGRLRPTSEPGRGTVGAKGVSVDLDAGVATCGGDRLALTPSETRLLALLLARPGRIVTRSTVIERLYGDRDPPGIATIDAHMRSLRRKLAAAGSEADVRLIREVDGYHFMARQAAA